MQTVIFDNIDGLEVVKGFGVPGIDPVETKKSVELLIVNTPEHAAVENRKIKIKDLIIEVRNEAKLASDATWKKQASKAAQHSNKSNSLQNEASLHMEELKLLNDVLNAVYKQLFIDNASYFTPKPTELIKPVSEIDALRLQFTDKGINKALLIDGSEIDDLRGQWYFEKISGKWILSAIGTINTLLPVNAKTVQELTDQDKAEITDQKDDDRIEKLSSTDKAQEKDELIDTIATQAATERSKLEIQGETSADALTQSQIWYNAELDKINFKYR